MKVWTPKTKKECVSNIYTNIHINVWDKRLLIFAIATMSGFWFGRVWEKRDQKQESEGGGEEGETLNEWGPGGIYCV